MDIAREFRVSGISCSRGSCLSVALLGAPSGMGRADAMDLPADDPRINTQVGVDVKVIITPRCILVFH